MSVRGSTWDVAPRSEVLGVKTMVFEAESTEVVWSSGGLLLETKELLGSFRTPAGRRSRLRGDCAQEAEQAMRQSSDDIGAFLLRLGGSDR